MREYDEYRQILELWEQKTPKLRIATTLGIPRGTVVDCIRRFGTLKGLEENKARASRSTSEKVLCRICNPQDVSTQQAYGYVLGLYLGDGYIVRSNQVYYLRIALDMRYPGIIERCFQSVQTLLPENKVNNVHSKRGNWVEVTCTYKFWPDLFPQHGAGMKHERPIILTDWQQQIIETYPLEFFRGLYHSDGSRFSNIVKGMDYPRYSFTNNSDDIRLLFCQTCDRLGLHWTAKSRYGHPTDIFISRRNDVEFLDSVIGPKT